jgi:hypothetical protein
MAAFASSDSKLLVQSIKHCNYRPAPSNTPPVHGTEHTTGHASSGQVAVYLADGAGGAVLARAHAVWAGMPALVVLGYDDTHCWIRLVRW